MKNQPWKRFLIAGAAALLLTTGYNVVDMQTAEAKVTTDLFDFQAHRGGRDARPENTLVSFAYALELGVTTLEMDMQMTKDGHIVISHNPVMNPNLAQLNGKYVEAGKYDIRTMTLAQVKQFDIGTMNPAAGDYYEGHGKTQLSVPGTKVPTLEEVFELTAAYGNDKVIFNIETKSYADPADPAYKNNVDPAAFVAKVNEIVKKYGMEDRVTLQSFDWRTLKEMKKINPNITLVALSSEQPSWGWVDGCYLKKGDSKPSPWLGGININDKKYLGDYVKAAHEIGADIVSPYWEELSNELVAEAHDYGMKVVPWTVNNPTKMNMLLNMGVDGMISDKPWLLREVLIKRGIKVAEPTVNINSPYHTGTDIVGGETKVTKKGGDSAE